MNALQRASRLILTLSVGTLAACTLASPTYVATGEEAITEDGGSGASSPASSPSGATSGGGGGQCAADDWAKPDLGTLTACGDGKGHCFAKNKTPPDLASQFVACPGKDTDVCVPDEILQAGGSKLKGCTSIIGAGGCITPSLIPEIQKQGGGALKQDVCDADQICAPCTNPLQGNAPTPFCQAIGVHEKECTAQSSGAGGGGDGGTSSPPPGCCTTKGKSNGVCITEAAIPEGQRDQAPQNSCTTGNKCVPAAFVEGKPVHCAAGILGDGVCMDKCFNSFLGIAGTVGVLKKEGCGETEVCAPCTFLKDQGVPGCS